MAVKCMGNHLYGIGGPGAPHVFVLERFQDTGRVRVSGFAFNLASCTVSDSVRLDFVGAKPQVFSARTFGPPFGDGA